MAHVSPSPPTPPTPPTTPRISRAYSLLGQIVTVRGLETAPPLAHRLDALLGPGASDERQDTCVTLTIQREGEVWRLADSGDAIPRTPLPTEEHLTQFVEWLAYREAVRHAAAPLILHSGAVARNGVAVLLPNVSGAGKTTLTLALAERGWLPLTDDVCPLEDRDGALTAVGCQRCCHLSASSLAILASLGIALDGPVANLSDYYRPRRWGEPAPVRAIVIPRYVAGSPTRFNAITQAECLGQLLSMLFTQGAHPGDVRRRVAARLAAEAPGFSLTYSALDEALDVFETLEAQSPAVG